jgi:lycopene beta-cyclase
MNKNYDYIFAGAGCAGLSLVMRLIKSGGLNSKKILIIDKSSKTSNDRTWCFWEKNPGFFESLVYHSWTNLSIYGSNQEESSKEASNSKATNNKATNKETTNKGTTNNETTNKETTNKGTTNNEVTNEVVTNNDVTKIEVANNEVTNNEVTNNEVTNNEVTKKEVTNKEQTSSDKTNYKETFDISPYRYKMIRGIDFYNDCFNHIKANQNITILNEEVLETGNTNGSAFAKTNNDTYTADYVFNSIPSKELSQKVSPQTYPSPPTTQSLNHSTHHSPLTTHHFLLQHFKGFIITSPTAVFDPNTGTLMDFRVSQQYGTSFVYVLPLSQHEALVEYTLFTGQLLQQEAYDEVVFEYIKQMLKIDAYDVVSSEFGVIPMTDIPFPANNGNVINIGTVGGQTKPSTGYTFTFIQKQADAIASLLAAGEFPVVKNNFTSKKFHWYDSILLRVLATGKLPGAFIFSELFRKNKITDVFRFLDNESNIYQDLKVIKALPAFIFVRAAIRQATKPPGSPVLHT